MASRIQQPKSFPSVYIQVIRLIASDMYNHTILVYIRALIETETNSELLFSKRNTSYLNHYIYHGIEANKILHY